MDYKPVALSANDNKGVEIISALLQDALLPPSDMTYMAGDNAFVVVANRVVGELSTDDETMRVNCALYIQGVGQVQNKNRPSDDSEIPLNILAVLYDNNAKTITLQFSDDIAVRLHVGDDFTLLLKDLDEPYTTPNAPKHDIWLNVPLIFY